MKDNKRLILNLILPVITVACLIAVWAVASYVVNSEYVLPSVGQTVEEFFALFSRAEFYSAFSFTLLRSLIAFAVAFALGFSFAVLSFKFSYFKKAVQPLIAVVRALPTIAIVLLLLFWTNSKIAPVVVTTLVVFPTVYTQIISALTSLDKTVTEAGRVDGASEAQVLSRVELPQVAPALCDTIGSGISLNFKLMVAAEVIAQTANSIGFMLNVSKVHFEIAQMLALVCVAVIFGVIIEMVFNRLSTRASLWK
jgi:NitT/TauT family transport system permease protein